MVTVAAQDGMCKLLEATVKDEIDAHKMYADMYGKFGDAPARLMAISGQEHEHYDFFRGIYNMVCNPEYNRQREEVVSKYLK